MHGTAKPYYCNLCTAGFVDQRSIVKHYSGSHNIDKPSKEIMKLVVRGKPEHGPEYIKQLESYRLNTLNTKKPFVPDV